MCDKNQLDEILNKIAKTYFNVYGDKVIKIVLYGSYARGDYTDYSDIDIVAIIKGEREDVQADLDKIWDVSSELELEYDCIISPTVIPYDEFESYKNDLPYYRNIENEGVEIVAW